MASATVYSFTFTLSATAAPLSTDVNIFIRTISIQPDAANANPVYIGGSDVTTSTGQRIPVPVTSIPSAPYILDGYTDGTVRLSDFYALGTANEKIRVLAIRNL